MTIGYTRIVCYRHQCTIKYHYENCIFRTRYARQVLGITRHDSIQPWDSTLKDSSPRQMPFKRCNLVPTLPKFRSHWKILSLLSLRFPLQRTNHSTVQNLYAFGLEILSTSYPDFSLVHQTLIHDYFFSFQTSTNIYQAEPGVLS